MLEGKAVVIETDMSEALQSRCLELAYQALDLHEVSDCQAIAQFIKQLCGLSNLSVRNNKVIFDNCLSNQKFDEAYGSAWHCVVGLDFGSCITHLCGNFIFFRVETVEFLVFKDGKELTESKEEAIGVLQKDGKVDS